MYRQSEKNRFKQQYLLHMSSQYGERGTLTAKFGSLVWATPANSNGFRYCTDVSQRRSTKLCTMFGRLLGWYTIHTLPGALAP